MVLIKRRADEPGMWYVAECEEYNVVEVWHPWPSDRLLFRTPCCGELLAILPEQVLEWADYSDLADGHVLELPGHDHGYDIDLVTDYGQRAMILDLATVEFVETEYYE